MSQSTFSSFAEFYPFYLSQHSDRRCRRLHFIGSLLVLASIGLALFHSPWWWIAAPIAGYGFAWVGHFGFEKNRPATFKHPFYSLLGDWVMFAQMLVGKIRF